jgi:hypothetical protein
MKRNLFGALMLAGGLTLWTSVAGLADYNVSSAKAAVAACATPLTLTDPATLTGEAQTSLTELNHEATLGMAEITADANAAIDEAAAEATDEDAAEANSEHGARNTSLLSDELTAIVNRACQEISELKTEYASAVAEIRAEAQPEAAATKPVVNQPKQTAEKDADTEHHDTERHQPEQSRPTVRPADRQGND